MAYERVEVITSVERRRRWSVQDKLRLVAESHQAAGGVGVVADQAGVHRSQLQRWRRQVRDGTLVAEQQSAPSFVPLAIDDSAAAGTPALVAGVPHGAVRRLVEIDLPNGCRVRVEQDIPTEALPDDIAALRALILRERAERVRLDAEALRLQSEAAQLEREVARLTALTERLDHIIAQLRRLQFGKRSEALDPDQLKLGLEDLESAAAEVEAEKEQADPELKTEQTRHRRQGRPSLPDHLPQVEVVIEPGSTTCPCYKGPLHLIGEDVSRRLDVVPAQYRILVTRRPSDRPPFQWTQS